MSSSLEQLGFIRANPLFFSLQVMFNTSFVKSVLDGAHQFGFSGT
jgi:hypothetical protein